MPRSDDEDSSVEGGGRSTEEQEEDSDDDDDEEVETPSGAMKMVENAWGDFCSLNDGAWASVEEVAPDGEAQEETQAQGQERWGQQNSKA